MLVRAPGWLRALAAGAWLVAGAALAQAPRLDVPFVPTRQVVVDEMLRLAEPRPGELLVDLGSGDGRIVITAAREFGARGIGIDLDPQRIREANENAKLAGVADRVEFLQRDLFTWDFSKADVVTMYLLQAVNLKLRPRLLAELRPGVRIVSHDFHMDDWEPDRMVVVSKTLYLWIVPARIGGTWQIKAGERVYTVEKRQRFQRFDGNVRVGEARPTTIWEGRIDGERVGFTIIHADELTGRDIGYRFEGRASGDQIEGTLRIGVGKGMRELPFRGVRLAREPAATAPPPPQPAIR
jgi:hypothetical protein